VIGPFARLGHLRDWATCVIGPFAWLPESFPSDRTRPAHSFCVPRDGLLFLADDLSPGGIFSVWHLLCVAFLRSARYTGGSIGSLLGGHRSVSFAVRSVAVRLAAGLLLHIGLLLHTGLLLHNWPSATSRSRLSDDRALRLTLRANNEGICLCRTGFVRCYDRAVASTRFRQGGAIGCD
jgi:hypothetical protein